MELTVEAFLEQAEKHWTKRELNLAFQGLRDLQYRLDNRRRLTHTINDGQVSTNFSVDFDKSDKVSLSISSSGYDPENSYHATHSSLYFTLSKEQLRELGKFVYFSSLEPGETINQNDSV